MEEDDLKIISLLPNIMGMMGDRMPTILRENDIKRIIKDYVLENHIESKRLKFINGERIVVSEGPFSSFEGIISEIKGEKVDIEVKIFGRNTTVSLTLEQIEKL